MKIFNFFLLLTCLALTPSILASSYLLYGSNEVESTALLNTFGNDVCPREEDIENGSGLISDFFESKLFAVGSPAMSIKELLGDISSHPFEQLDGELLWEKGQAAVEGAEEIAESVVEKVQEGFAPVIEQAEETFECVETFIIESFEDLLQFYDVFPWVNEAADEDCNESAEEEEVGKTPEADVTTEEKEKCSEAAVIEPEIAPVAENVSTPASLREVEREKVLKMINSIVSVGFLGSISLAYLSIAAILYVFLKEYLDEMDAAHAKQHFDEMLAHVRKCRKSGPKALPAPKKPLALPAPPKKKKKDQGAQTTEVLPWPLEEGCSSETNVSMEDVSQSCA